MYTVNAQVKDLSSGTTGVNHNQVKVGTTKSFNVWSVKQ